MDALCHGLIIAQNAFEIHAKNKFAQQFHALLRLNEIINAGYDNFLTCPFDYRLLIFSSVNSVLSVVKFKNFLSLDLSQGL